jgi:hypothetical protein
MNSTSSKSDKFDVDQLIDFVLKKESVLPEFQVKMLCEKVKYL